MTRAVADKPTSGSELAAAAHLARRLRHILASDGEVSPDSVEALVAPLAALLSLALSPQQPTWFHHGPAAALLPARPAAACFDHTVFAERLTAVARQAEPLLRRRGAVRALRELLAEEQTAAFLASPLAAGWVYQAVLDKPRWQAAGLTSGASTQSARAREIDEGKIARLTQWFTPSWVSDFLVRQATGTAAPWRGRFIDPACGAGHILVPALHHLVELGVSGGTTPGRALAAVLEEQLYGCDVDEQVALLSWFSLYLACRRLVPDGELPLPQVFFFEQQGEPQASPAIGSLWLGASRTPPLPVRGPAGRAALGGSPLAGDFAAVATNPPYLSHRLMPPAVSAFLKEEYRSGRYDLYAAFLTLCRRILAPGGRLALILQQSFMSVARYRNLRQELLSDCQMLCLVQLGPGVFAARSGEKVSNALLVARRGEDGEAADTPVRCWRVLTATDRRKAGESGLDSLPSHKASPRDFSFIPGSPFSFWCPPELARLFGTHPALADEGTGVTVTNGLFTCNNARFVRLHRDVPQDERHLWVPYDKGGGHKWYRHTPYLLFWDGDGRHIRQYRRQRGQSPQLPGERYYFQPGVTYSYIGTKGFKARLLSPACVFDIASSAVFSEKVEPLYILGLLNSALVRFLLGVLNPTVNFQVGDLRRLPFRVPDREVTEQVVGAVSQAVQASMELDSFSPLSPRYAGPALSRYGSAQPQQAFLRHRQWLEEVNHRERRCQATIDEVIFDHYGVSAQCRRLIYEDPWVASGRVELSRMPSYGSLLDELRRG